MNSPVVVVGAGWSGAVVANRLGEAGVPVDVLERAAVVGGHARVESLCGVVYEPNGPHILHTDNEAVAVFLQRLGLSGRPYRFQPKTEIELTDGSLRLMSWPVQVSELEELPDWPRIKQELGVALDRGGRPVTGDDFETYAVSLMGRRLYELFVEQYTRKQWGREPCELSSSFAPKRIDVRYDGNRDLFLDRWQWFPPEGVNSAIEYLVSSSGAALTCGAEVRAADLVGADCQAVVVTAALDEFVGREEGMEWRGVHVKSSYIPTYPEELRTRSYVINRPHCRVPFTRTIETKHATGQWASGTVVSEEYPGAPARHYPVADVHGTNAATNSRLQAEVRAMLAPVPVFFTGRLANYRYINQDEAIAQAWDCADAVLRKVR